MSSTTATRSYGVRILYSVIIFSQSDTRNKEYVTGYLKKISLQQLFFELGTLSEPLVFKHRDFSKSISMSVL